MRFILKTHLDHHLFMTMLVPLLLAVHQSWGFEIEPPSFLSCSYSQKKNTLSESENNVPTFSTFRERLSEGRDRYRSLFDLSLLAQASSITAQFFPQFLTGCSRCAENLRSGWKEATETFLPC